MKKIADINISGKNGLVDKLTAEIFDKQPSHDELLRIAEENSVRFCILRGREAERWLYYDGATA